MSTAWCEFATPNGSLPALWAQPTDWDRGPGILMVHENLGLTTYMRRVVSDLCDLGAAVLAPDLMWKIHGAGATTRARPMEHHVEALLSALDHLESIAGRVAIVGFCFGAEAGMLAALDRPELAAVVAWYGIPPPPRAAHRFNAPLLLMLAADDQRVNRHVPGFLSRLATSNPAYVATSFPGTRHAFHDSSRPDRHDPEAARAAWAQQVGFLDTHLWQAQR